MTQYQPAPQNKTNTMAIVGFILSLVCCGFIGAILSGIALGQIKQSGENGKGLAIAGLVVGILSTIAGIIYGIVFLILDSNYYY
jgi:peptidyl-prolyl cis-trans isomerase B (cyclophilin B)